MPEWWGYLSLIERGAWVTFQITVLGCALALTVSFIAGMGRISRNRPARWLAVTYIEFFRGTSGMVQLFWLFYVLPFAGIRFEPMVIGIIGVGLNVGSFGAEVVRGAILAVPKGQTEAAITLNFTRWQRMRRVILPQAIPAMLPPFGNLGIELLKMSAVVSLITIGDLTFQAQVFRLQTGMTAEPFGILLVIYFLFASLIALGARRMERRVSGWAKSE